MAGLRTGSGQKASACCDDLLVRNYKEKVPIDRDLLERRTLDLSPPPRVLGDQPAGEQKDASCLLATGTFAKTAGAGGWCG